MCVYDSAFQDLPHMEALVVESIIHIRETSPCNFDPSKPVLIKSRFARVYFKEHFYA